MKPLNHDQLSINDVQSQIRKALAGRYIKAIRRRIKPSPAHVDYKSLPLRDLRRVAIEHLTLIYGGKLSYSITRRQPWMNLEPNTTAAAIITVQAVIDEINRRKHLPAATREQLTGPMFGAILFWLESPRRRSIKS